MKQALNKWQLVFGFHPCWYKERDFELWLGVFKMIKRPEEGVAIKLGRNPEYYKGFIWKWEIKTWRGFNIDIVFGKEDYER